MRYETHLTDCYECSPDRILITPAVSPHSKNLFYIEGTSNKESIAFEEHFKKGKQNTNSQLRPIAAPFATNARFFT